MRTKLLAATLAGIMLFTGCLSQTALAALVTTLGGATSALAGLQGNPTLAAQIKIDTAAASSAVLNWKKGSPAQMVVEALGIVEDDLHLIPFTGPYIPLISLALVTVQEIVTIVTAKSPTPVVARKAKVAARQVSYAGKAPKNSGDFKKAWNKIAAADPHLASAKIN